MIYDREPLPPPPGMSFQQMLALRVDEGPWRESHRYVCIDCIQNAFHHPYTNVIWGCRQCSTTTTDLVNHFISQFVDDSGKNEASPAEMAASMEFHREAAHRNPPVVAKPLDQLSEFKVTLQRMPPGEHAVDPDNRQNRGTRTKLGGLPDWIQLNDDTPTCARCQSKMTFVAQIDSIEHISLKNPFGMDFQSRDASKKPWMFGDVGMIYVFFCFECSETKSVLQSY